MIKNILKYIYNYGLFSFHITFGKLHFYLGLFKPSLNEKMFNNIEINLLWGGAWVFQLKHGITFEELVKRHEKTTIQRIFDKLTNWRDDPTTPEWLIKIIDWIRYELLWDHV
jgi:hypothetical protein